MDFTTGRIKLMSTSMPLGFEPLDWAPPWHIERPPQIRPPLGPERTAWLEQRLLFQAGKSLKSVLDRIDPAIARNKPVTAIDEDTATVALLEFLEPQETNPTEDAPISGKKKRLPMHHARVFLAYFSRGFREYCQSHGLRQPRLPLIREFSLDEGSLQANAFSTLREYRHCIHQLINEIELRIITPAVPNETPEGIAALLTCSSALFGGLTRKAHWEALITALAFPLKRCGEIFAFTFDRPAPYRWIADPISEALLRRLWHCRLLPLPENTKPPPRLIQHFLDLKIATNAVWPHLEQLVSTAHVRHFAPDVAAVAQGLISNTPLAEEAWLRLISGTRHPAPRATVALAIPRIALPTPANSLQQVGLQSIIDDISAAVRWDPNARRRAGDQEAREGEGVRQYFSKARVTLRAAESKLEQHYARAGFPERHRYSFIYGLLVYARDLLELGGLKVRTLAPSTIDNYVSIVRNHLAQLHFEDLVALGTEARADAYRKNIRQQVVKERKIHRTAFEGFERSLLRHIDLIDEVDWGSIPGRARNRHLPSVDANLVDPALYQHVFDSLQEPKQSHPIVELARALLIVLYRFGLRTGEAAELTAGALTLHADGCASLRVGRSTLTTRKSTNALRLVGPIALPRQEFEFLTEYRDHRIAEAARRGRDRAGSYLFATGAGNRLDHVEPAQALLIEALRAASGDTHLRPRHLRHSFVSRVLLSGRDALELFDPISTTAVCDAWWRTFVTGHASPETGINSYGHVVELAHYQYVSGLVGEEVPLAFLSKLAGINSRSLERAQLRHGKNSTQRMRLFRERLRRNFPCADMADMLAYRVQYQPICLGQAREPIYDDDQRPSWEAAWSVYSNARVGRTTLDLSEPARVICQRVHDLEIRERLARRLKRRPQLSAEESAVAATLWQSLPTDHDLQRLIIAVTDWLRPAGTELLMPAELARELELLLRHRGLSRIDSRAGPAQKRWLWLTNDRGQVCCGWFELLAFLYTGTPQKHENMLSGWH
jgi:site-specific recombinase XerC